MSLFSDLRERWVALFSRSREEAALDEELRFHLEKEMEKNMARGMSPEEARRRARIALGGVERTKEEVRDARGVRPLEDLVRDLRLAARSFSRTPGFTLTAVLVVALGIGGTTAIFSAVRAVILQPLPVAQPDQLYMLWESNPERGWEQETAAPANYLDWKERVDVFADVEAHSYGASRVTLTGLDQPLVLNAMSVTGGYFDMLGIRPMLGRSFTEEETWASATWRAGETPILLSARTWETVFGGTEDVIGRAVTYNSTPGRIVGVMPEGFRFPDRDIDLWVPFGWADEAREAAWFRRAHWIRPIARLAGGTTPEQATAQLETVAAQLEQEHPNLNRHMGVGMTPLQDFLVGDTRTPLLVLLGAVGLLLIIACANVGNLLLVRASARRRDLAVRTALGAGRGRLARQMLTESAVIAGLGGAAGLALGILGTRLLEQLQPEGLLRVAEFPVDGGVIAFAAVATGLSALFFGTFPTLIAGRSGPGEALRDGGRSGGKGRGVRRLVGGLVVGEVALAVLLALGAGLLVRSVAELRQVDPGFDPEGVAAISLAIPGADYQTGEEVVTFYDRLLERVRGLPGVESAALSTTLPLRERGFTGDLSVQGRPVDEYLSEVVRRRVSGGYFETMGVPIVSGRLFTEADIAARPVALINETLARQSFPGADPVGQQVTLDRHPDSTSVWRTVLGVVADERQSQIATPAQPEIIMPFQQYPNREAYLYVKTAGGDPATAVPGIRSIVQELDPDLPLHGVTAMDDVVADAMARDRFVTLLLVAFAAMAMILALVGVYGVTAQAVRQRLPELGIRMALGARSRDIISITLRHAFGLVAIGLGIGLAGAAVATRTMESLLFGVTPNDPATFLAVAVLITAAGVTASGLPAVRAARVNPADTLRAE